MCSISCFTNFISYTGSGITPTSGLVVNDLYGFYFTKADAIANTDYATGVEFIESVLDRAVVQVANELKRYIMPYFKMHSIVAHYTGGEFDDDLGYHGVGTADRGIRIDIDESSLATIVINSVRVLFNDAGAQNITVTDGTDTDVTAVTLVAGEEQDVQIDYTCMRNRVYITMDDALHPAEGKANGGCCMPDYDILDVDGWNGSVASSHYGIKADISIVCSIDKFACLMKDVLGWAVLYRFGMEAAKEALYTDRLNYFTLVNRDEINELLERYTADYEREMETIGRDIPKMLRQLDPYCITCNQAKHIEVVP